MHDDVDDLSLDELILESHAWWRWARHGHAGGDTKGTIVLSGQELVGLVRTGYALCRRDAREGDPEYDDCRRRLSDYCRVMRRRRGGGPPW